MGDLVGVIEHAIHGHDVEVTPLIRHVIEGRVRGRPVRVVLARNTDGCLTIVTAMWC
jgi:hypothetical protein